MLSSAWQGSNDSANWERAWGNDEVPGSAFNDIGYPSGSADL